MSKKIEIELKNPPNYHKLGVEFTHGQCDRLDEYIESKIEERLTIFKEDLINSLLNGRKYVEHELIECEETMEQEPNKKKIKRDDNKFNDKVCSFFSEIHDRLHNGTITVKEINLVKDKYNALGLNMFNLPAQKSIFATPDYPGESMFGQNHSQTMTPSTTTASSGLFG